MPNYWCYEDQRPRELCPKNEDGVCEKVADSAAEYRAEKAAGKYSTPYIMSMPGGTTTLSKQMDHTRKFDKDMHSYREAVRSGEQPDTVSVEGVEKAQKRTESLARAREKIGKG